MLLYILMSSLRVSQHLMRGRYHAKGMLLFHQKKGSDYHYFNLKIKNSVNFESTEGIKIFISDEVVD